MTSKFQTRLKRLHDSRKRTSALGEAPAGVYVASEEKANPEAESPPVKKTRSTKKKAAVKKTSLDPAWAALGARAITNGRGEALLVQESFDLETRHGSCSLSTCYETPSLEIARLVRRRDLIDLKAEEQVYLDIETTGLERGTFAFCVGLGRWIGEAFVVEQFLTEDPDQEAAMLFAVAEVLKSSRLLISFNGDRFDVSRLIARYEHNKMASPFGSLPHLDLLPLSRKLLTGQARYNLGSLEENVLGFFRKDDVPGKDIPPLWKRYLRSRDASLLGGVLEHNRWDIVSMTALLEQLVLAKTSSGAPRPKPTPPRSIAEETSAIGSRLARSYALKDRSGPNTAGGGKSRDVSVSLGDYLKGLREKSEKIIAERGVVEALPYLHEMVALAPHHPYALEHLVRYHRERAEKTLVELYEARLKRGSPF